MKLHQILFSFLILLLPTQLGKHFWPEFSLVFGLRVDYLAPTIYLTDLLALGTLLSWFWESKNKIEDWKLPAGRQGREIGNFFKDHWLIMAIFVYLLLSSFLAKNEGAAFYKWSKIVEFSLLGLYIAKNTDWISGLMAKLLSFGVVYEAILAWAQFFQQGSLGGFFWFLGERTFTAGTPGIALAQWGERLFLRPYGTFPHPNAFAGYFLVALILIWSFVWQSQGLSFWWRLAIFSLGFLAIILSFSQAVWLATAFLFLAPLVYFYWSQRKIGKKLFFFLFTIIFLTIFSFWTSVDFASQPIKERLLLLQAASQMFFQFPLTGVGLNNFVVYLPRLLSGQEIYLLQPVHNLFLLVATETGLVGFLIFTWLVFLSLKRGFVLAKKNYPGPLMALSAILFLGLFDHYWWTLQQNQLLATIVVALALSSRVNKVE